MQVGLPASEFTRHAGEATALLRVLANEFRLLVLCHLAESGSLTPRELVDRVGISQTALAPHLARLREERLVAKRKDGQTVSYHLCDPKAEQVLMLLHDLYCRTPGGQSEADRGASRMTADVDRSGIG